MTASTHYIVDIEYQTHGSPGAGIDDVEAKAKRLAAAQKRLGKELVDLGHSAADAYTGAVEQVGHLVAAGAGMALGAAFAGAVYGVGTLNANLEQTQYSLAAIGEGNGWVHNFNEGLQHAAATMKTMHADAAKGLGTYEDLAHIFASMATPAGQAGMSEVATEKMASRFMNFAKVQGVEMSVAARQAANLLAGRAGAHNTLGMRLGLGGDAAKAFNKTPAEARAATLERLLAEKLKPDALAAFTNTYAAQSTTLISNLKDFGGKATEMLFDRVVATLIEVNTWVAKNKDEVDHWANVISTKLIWAWDHGKALILEWGPLVMDFADRAGDRIGAIWADWKPTIDSVGEALKDALNPGTLDKIIHALELYAAVKVGGGLISTFGGVAASAVGAAGGLGPAGAALAAAAPVILAATAAFVGVTLAVDQYGKLQDERAQYERDAASQTRDLLANMADSSGQVDRASHDYQETLIDLRRNSGDAAAALFDLTAETRNAELGLMHLVHSQQTAEQSDDVDRRWRNAGYDALNAIALRDQPLKKPPGPGAGAGHTTMIVYQTISSNQSPGQIAASTIAELARAIQAKKFSDHGPQLTLTRR